MTSSIINLYESEFDLLPATGAVVLQRPHLYVEHLVWGEEFHHVVVKVERQVLPRPLVDAAHLSQETILPLKRHQIEM